jgi:acetyl esterase/lipase
MYGIIGDVKRAIAWMKANASRYGVNPEKIALVGNSVGGHLALVAAYTPQHPELTPEDVGSASQSVCGVVSYYGPTDLLAAYEHENQQQFVGEPSVPIGKSLDSKEFQRIIGRFDIVLGGHPQDALNTYQLASPVTHVRPGCPPTLLIQGDKDLLVPVDATRALYTRLVESGVPAINIVLPWTDHGFDMLFPQVSPPSQSVLYDVDRFLALLVNED